MLFVFLYYLTLFHLLGYYLWHIQATHTSRGDHT